MIVFQVRHELELKLKEKQNKINKITEIVECRDSELKQKLDEVLELKLLNKQIQLEYEKYKSDAEASEEMKCSVETRIQKLSKETEILRDLKFAAEEENLKLKQQICDLKSAIESSANILESMECSHKIKIKELVDKINLLQDEVVQVKDEAHDNLVKCNEAEHKMKEFQDLLESQVKETEYLR